MFSPLITPGSSTGEFDGTLEEFDELANDRFAMEWKIRYLMYRAQLLPDIGRWMRLLRFFHPRVLQDHWQDQYGNPLPKLYFSQNLSVEIYNWCRPIIEVYGSLLAGQKPMPFDIDVPPINPSDDANRFISDAQEKILRMELYHQKIPLHFMDFCVSVVLFGIGYVMSWIDPKDKRLRTQTIPWPGDVMPQWGSDHYGRGAEGLESVIITERLPVDAANRLYGGKFNRSQVDLTMRPDGQSQMYYSAGTTQIIKVWWRWDDEKEKEHIGYSEIAIDGVQNQGTPTVLYRDDDTKYPDIPVRWASRFPTPGEPPHRAAGVLDDVVGINTEYDEKLSALADQLMKTVYTKYKAKGFTIANAPRLSDFSNTIPMNIHQDLLPLDIQHSEVHFEGFLTRLETMMMTSAGLSRLVMGVTSTGMPGGDSGEAMQQLLHASISRLEVVRTPIQWAWQSLMDEIWVPLLSRWGKYSATDTLTGKTEKVSLKPIFQGFNRVDWIWPDVTPKDQIRAAELAMNAGRGGWFSDETVMKRLQVASTVDEIEKIKKERQDIILHPQAMRDIAQAEQTVRMISGGMPPAVQTKLNLKGDLTPDAIIAEEQRLQLVPKSPGQGAQPGQPPQSGQGGSPQQMANSQASMTDMNQKLAAAQQPTLSPADNAPAPGSPQNAVQGIQQPAPNQISR